MIEKIIHYLQDKNILILGFGKEGHSTYKFIKKYLPEKSIGIADYNQCKLDEVLNDTKVIFYSGESYLESINKYNFIIKSPGVSLKDICISPIKDKLSSQTDLFLMAKNSSCIGVTGTKGKSTTSTLIKHIISMCNDNAYLIGNIGIPPFEILEQIKDDTIIVMEMSSHQLEYVNHSPNISILLNIYEEHLDHYLSYEHYQRAKLNIYKYQKEEDYIIYNKDESIVRNYVENDNLNNTQIGFSVDNINEFGAYIKNNYIYYKDEQILHKDQCGELIGKHYLYDVLAGVCVCKLLNISNEDIIKGIQTFKRLEHRMEYVGVFDDIAFYNDSIATIPQSTIAAIESIKKVTTLIAGGLDRGINYYDFSIYLVNSDIENLILLPDTGYMIEKYIKINNSNINKNIYIAKDLNEAVQIAKKVTPKNSVCLFSPAAASYGFFKNFEERGKVFKSLVQGL